METPVGTFNNASIVPASHHQSCESSLAPRAPTVSCANPEASSTPPFVPGGQRQSCELSPTPPSPPGLGWHQ